MILRRFLGLVPLLGALVALTFSTPIKAAPSVFEPVEAAGTIDLPGIGEVPREIIWTADGSHMVLIPGGEYTLGHPAPPTPAEGPPATVTLEPFYIDKFEVRYEQYLKVARETGLGVPRSQAFQNLLAEGKPIIGISHDDALNYAQSVRKDLPTEAEWEAAARGKEGNLYPWGSNPEPGVAVLGLGGGGTTKPVDQLGRDVSPYGVVGMGGNVSEWTKDRYHRDYYRRVDGQTNPEVTDATESVTVRGGNFFGRSDGRVTLRTPQIPTSVREEVGFRTVFRVRPRPVEVAEATPAPSPTPGPTRGERIEDLLEVAYPHFVDPRGNPIGRGLRGRSLESRPMGFLNATPYTLTIGFGGTDSGRLYDFPQQLSAASYQTLQVPHNLSVRILAWAPGSPFEDRLLDLGGTHTTARPLVFLRHDLLGPVIMPDGEIAPAPERPEARQIYPGAFHPRWNDFSIFNGTGYPVELTVRSSRDGAGVKVEVLDAGDVFFFEDAPPAEYTLTAKYIGAAEEVTSNEARFINNDSAQARTVLLQPNTASARQYRVATRELPEIGIRVRDIRLPSEALSLYVPGAEGSPRRR